MKIKSVERVTNLKPDGMRDWFNYLEVELCNQRTSELVESMNTFVKKQELSRDVMGIVASTEAEDAHRVITELNSCGVLSRIGIQIVDDGAMATPETLQAVEIHCEGFISGTIAFVEKIITAIVDGIIATFKWIAGLFGFKTSSGGGGGGSSSKNMKLGKASSSDNGKEYLKVMNTYKDTAKSKFRKWVDPRLLGECFNEYLRGLSNDFQFPVVNVADISKEALTYATITAPVSEAIKSSVMSAFDNRYDVLDIVKYYGREGLRDGAERVAKLTPEAKNWLLGQCHWTMVNMCGPKHLNGPSAWGPTVMKEIRDIINKMINSLNSINSDMDLSDLQYEIYRSTVVSSDVPNHLHKDYFAIQLYNKMQASINDLDIDSIMDRVNDYKALPDLIDGVNELISIILKLFQDPTVKKASKAEHGMIKIVNPLKSSANMLSGLAAGLNSEMEDRMRCAGWCTMVQGLGFDLVEGGASVG